jgi:predicted small lipoprotein YifL
MIRSAIACLALLFALAGCGQPAPSASPSPSGSQPSPSGAAASPSPGASPSPVIRSATDGTFELVITSPSQTWTAGETIELTAELTYVGGAASVEVTGSGSGLVGFSLEQLDGGLDVSGVSTSDCRPYQLTQGQAMSRGYQKSGGASDSDPNAAAILAFIRDPVFRLPAGSFVVRATFSGTLGGCGGEQHGLAVELPLTIVP